MKKIFVIFPFLLLCLYAYPQTKNESACNDLKAKGYTKQFCDYNSKYAYKNIPFESSFDFVSSKLNLTKQTGSANQYDCKDGDVINWATVKFDNCIFEFSSNDKLDGIQLQLIGNYSEAIKAEIKEKLLKVKDYLTLYFGKPEKFPGSTETNMWRGDKVYIVISGLKDASSGLIAIYRTNTNPVDDL